MEYVTVPREVFDRHPNAFALEADGRCMEPTVLDGDIVLVDPFITPSEGNDLAAVEIGGEHYLGRLVFVGERLLLIHDNPEYPTNIFPCHAVRILGAVVFVMKASILPDPKLLAIT